MNVASHVSSSSSSSSSRKTLDGWSRHDCWKPHNVSSWSIATRSSGKRELILRYLDRRSTVNIYIILFTPEFRKPLSTIISAWNVFSRSGILIEGFIIIIIIRLIHWYCQDVRMYIEGKRFESFHVFAYDRGKTILRQERYLRIGNITARGNGLCQVLGWGNNYTLFRDKSRQIQRCTSPKNKSRIIAKQKLLAVYW